MGLERGTSIGPARRVGGLPAWFGALRGLCAVLILVVTLVAAPMPGIASVIAPSAAAAAIASGAYSSSPFVSSSRLKTWYRIPAIIRTQRGSLLAFAEKRDNNTDADMGDFDIVMRKSTDGGRTWGPVRTVADDGRNRVSNPVPVIDPLTGDVLLITGIRNANNTPKGAFIQRSADDGGTFTSLARGRLSPVDSSRFSLAGPGHAISLTHGEHAGRIVVATTYIEDRHYGVYGMYSDDGGHVWRTGYDQCDTTGHTALIEGTIAELANGDLYIGYRNKIATGPRQSRYCAISSDGGETIDGPFRPASNLRLTCVEGSTLSLDGTGSGTLLYSSPTFFDAAHPKYRFDMGIFLSTDAGATWGQPYQVELVSRQAAYSDLVRVDSGGVGILYETGTRKWRERIVFRYIPIAELTDPVRVASSLRARVSARTVTASRRATVRVAVTVKGISAPPGRVTVTLVRGDGYMGRASVTLTRFTAGTRSVNLPRLHAGKYAITVSYRGTARIAGRTISAGTLHVR